jgi:hypothetical protein
MCSYDNISLKTLDIFGIASNTVSIENVKMGEYSQDVNSSNTSCSTIKKRVHYEPSFLMRKIPLRAAFSDSILNREFFRENILAF